MGQTAISLTDNENYNKTVISVYVAQNTAGSIYVPQNSHYHIVDERGDVFRFHKTLDQPIAQDYSLMFFSKIDATTEIEFEKNIFLFDFQ